MPIKSQYVKQLVIELDNLFEAHGLEIKKPLSRIAFLINKLQPFFSNKEVWFESINQEQLQIMQKHLLNMNLSLIDTLALMSQIN